MPAVISSYSPSLVLLSVVIAVFASYTVLDVAARVTAAQGCSQVIWLCCGALVMGMGIWAMHFVGMLACRLPFLVEYDAKWVAISMLPAVFASGLALFFVSRETLDWPRLTVGSVLMGSGIAAMHYTGMAAMRMPALMRYDWRVVGVSIAIAIAVSLVGLFLVFRLRVDSTHQLRKRILAAVVMGAAIPTMHYTGMAAARFVPSQADGVFEDALRAPENCEILVISVVVSTAIIFAIAWTSTFLDRLKDSESRARALAEKQEQLNKQLRQSETLQRQKNEELQAALHKLKEVQLQLIQAEKMSSLGQLVAGIAHEVNNPVNFIHGNLNHVSSYVQDLLNLVELFQQNYPTPVEPVQTCIDDIDLEFLQADIAKVLASMKMGTERIGEIVLSLRNFSRLDEGALKRVNIYEGIDSTLIILQHRLKATPNLPRVELIRDYAELPDIDCYPGLLNQVFMNIFANALDALVIATEKPVITIRTSLIDNDWVEIAIADNGPGIPEETKARIFDPFFTTKPIGKGTGMGLSISYKIIVEQHSGKLDCFSDQGQGTEFVIRIPIHHPGV